VTRAVSALPSSEVFMTVSVAPLSLRMLSLALVYRTQPLQTPEECHT